MVYADGALAWDCAAKKMNKTVKMVHVKHNKSIFTRRLKRKPRRKASSLAGTQQVDRIWNHLKTSIPKTLQSRKGRSVNLNMFMSFCHQFQWRRNQPDVYTALAKLCRSNT